MHYKKKLTFNHVAEIYVIKQRARADKVPYRVIFSDVLS